MFYLLFAVLRLIFRYFQEISCVFFTFGFCGLLTVFLFDILFFNLILDFFSLIKLKHRIFTIFEKEDFLWQFFPLPSSLATA